MSFKVALLCMCLVLANARPDATLYEKESKVQKGELLQSLQQLFDIFQDVASTANAVATTESGSESSTAAAVTTDKTKAPTTEKAATTEAAVTTDKTEAPTTKQAATTEAAVTTIKTEAPTTEQATTTTAAVTTVKTEVPTTEQATTTAAAVTTVKTEAPTTQQETTSTAAAVTTVKTAAPTTETTEASTTVTVATTTEKPDPKPCSISSFVKAVSAILKLVRNYVTDITSDIYKMESEVMSCISPLSKASIKTKNIFHCNIPAIIKHFVEIPLIQIKFVTNLIVDTRKLQKDFSSCF